jgi:hypothetical protein
MKNFYDKEIDEDDLRTKYKADPLFRTLMDVLAAQEKDYRQITVEQVCDLMAKAGAAVRRPDVIRMLQSVNGGHRGWFTIGRRGYSSRFDFYVPSRVLGKAASGKGTAKTAVPTMLMHKFRLRANLEISLDLPSDLSDKEVGRITDFIKTLPFDPADLSVAA